MATRIALLRSAAQQEQKGVTGSALAQNLAQEEERCLLRISSAARDSHNLQVALNAVTRAQNLDIPMSAAASIEFAHVLWTLDEQKAAIQSLGNVVLVKSEEASEDRLKQASLLAQLVCISVILRNYCLRSHLPGCLERTGVS
jgi:serine-protein kinase ATM